MTWDLILACFNNQNGKFIIVRFEVPTVVNLSTQFALFYKLQTTSVGSQFYAMNIKRGSITVIALNKWLQHSL